MMEVRDKPEKKQIVYAKIDRGQRLADHTSSISLFGRRELMIHRKIAFNHRKVTELIESPEVGGVDLSREARKRDILDIHCVLAKESPWSGGY